MKIWQDTWPAALTARVSGKHSPLTRLPPTAKYVVALAAIAAASGATLVLVDASQKVGAAASAPTTTDASLPSASTASPGGASVAAASTTPSGAPREPPHAARERTAAARVLLMGDASPVTGGDDRGRQGSGPRGQQDRLTRDSSQPDSRTRSPRV